MLRLSRFKVPVPGKQYAFSLVELLVTMTVLAIVIGVAVPSFQSQLSRNSAEALSEDMIFALQLARSEAIKRSAFVVLCPSLDGLSCSGDRDGWEQGFIAVVDYSVNENTLAPVLTNPANPSPNILHVWERQKATAVLDVYDTANVAAKPVSLGTARSFIRFNNLGRLKQQVTSAEGIVINTKMKIKDNSTTGPANCVPRSGRQYTIGFVGAVRLTNEDCW